ncbi:uncharacterized protein LOC130744356 [Lotus japonicus]|uniref:uncharacterized protein LOC130744356 n=1 Tax=Lotus japonicus TaxID=34305 RepID=UPI0025858966|nr:uncharacterized protein LOC130744356 [Lotus japonicus]
MIDNTDNEENIIEQPPIDNTDNDVELPPRDDIDNDENVLQKSDLSGKLVAWSVELSEYGLKYVKRGKVGAESLTDFVVELTPEAGERISTQWTLFVDGSSNENGSGAGVTLQGPGELILEQSPRFQFKASNNQAEYEALIAGLKLAIVVQIDSLLVRTDSLLVAIQVNEVFQVKEPALIKYLERVRLLMGRSMIQETLANPSIEGELVACVECQKTWMDPIVDILRGEPSEVVRYTKNRGERRDTTRCTVFQEDLARTS